MALSEGTDVLKTPRENGRSPSAEPRPTFEDDRKREHERARLAEEAEVDRAVPAPLGSPVLRSNNNQHIEYEEARGDGFSLRDSVSTCDITRMDSFGTLGFETPKKLAFALQHTEEIDPLILDEGVTPKLENPVQFARQLSRQDSVSSIDATGLALVSDIASHWTRNISEWLIPNSLRLRQLYQEMYEASTYEQYCKVALMLDDIEGKTPWKFQMECDDYDSMLIFKRLEELREASKKKDLMQVMYLLRSGLFRNLGGMLNDKLYSKTHVGTKVLIEQYIDEVAHQLKQIGETDIPGLPLVEKLAMFEDIRRSFGRSALLMSGGGALAMYHLGVCKALWEQGLLPRILSGSSGGALISCLLCCTKDEDVYKLFEDDGFDVQAFNNHGETWSFGRKVLRLMSKGYLVPNHYLRECIRRYAGDMTFRESYNMTGRILNISINSSQEHEGPRLLNYLTAPDVTIWSGACASCAMPGLMPSVELMAKDDEGKIVPWNQYESRWMDGSLEADLPMLRLSELFNVNHFIVSQVNPHINPVMRVSHFLPKSLLMIGSSEIRHRCSQMINLGIVPKLFIAIREILAQDYYGNVTLAPPMRLWDFAKIISNPTNETIAYGVKTAQFETFRHMSAIQNHLEIEQVLDSIVVNLRRQTIMSTTDVAGTYSAISGVNGVPRHPNLRATTSQIPQITRRNTDRSRMKAVKIPKRPVLEKTQSVHKNQIFG
eukprot:Clim_evm85s172 gene=Clim_evmTU85s172